MSLNLTNDIDLLTNEIELKLLVGGYYHFGGCGIMTEKRHVLSIDMV
ncbi:MAG: hypothetical protein KUG82_01615 [Pseudomonadales bacterium]|nr:hypothetical protein [Pseudomonadales bacterium]